jgi:hypothetical protein
MFCSEETSEIVTFLSGQKPRLLSAKILANSSPSRVVKYSMKFALEMVPIKVAVVISNMREVYGFVKVE